jgi:hypothetical protein
MGRFAALCMALCATVLLVASACAQNPTTTCTTTPATSSHPVPVTAADQHSWLGTTTSGTGSANLYGLIQYAADQPRGQVDVGLYDSEGAVERRAGLYNFSFVGLKPGSYRLAVSGSATGYVSQWYGGLPMQGHDIAEAQLLELKPGSNDVRFLMQPGLSIKGTVAVNGGSDANGMVWVYDLEGRDTLHRAAFSETGTRFVFLIVGLLPGRYKIGVSFMSNYEAPEYWYGGSTFEAATEVDLTSTDVTGLEIDMTGVSLPAK